ncbi:MAG: 4Fe-4S dicluster domain-containing protein [Chloroflexota bacterium]
MLKLSVAFCRRQSGLRVEKNLNQNRFHSGNYRVCVLKERCKGCSFCIDFCPQHTLVRSNELNSHGYHVVYQDDDGHCTGCEMCTMICPEFALDVVKESEE